MWQLLLKQFLGQAVQEQVRSQVQDAAAKALNPDELAADRLSPCDVGIIMAMGIEAGPIEDWLTDKIAVTGPTFSVKVGNWQGRRIAVMRAGVGLAAAEKGIAALIAGHQPKWVISAGFGGGLHADLNVGDLVLANQLVNPHGERLQLDVRGAPAAPTGSTVRVGAIFTSETPLKTPAQKQAAGEQHQALAVDMETWAVAQHCSTAGQKFLAVRVISDRLQDELPHEIEKLIPEQSLAKRAGSILGSVFRRPSVVKDMWNLQEAAWLCNNRLSEFLQTLVKELVTERK
jgi:adenosylhomocysteine nucleosidase